MKERQYLFSNLKAFLIFTVVFGHMVQLLPESTARSFLMLWIYSFHMPAFIFVSGYFSKNVQKSYEKAYENYFLPFLFMTVVYVILRLIFVQEFAFRLIMPVFAAWYILVVFYYKRLLRYLSKIPAGILFPITIGISLISGLIPMIGDEYALGRTISFLPFFLAGFYLKKEQLEAWKKRISIPAAIGALIIISAGFLYYVFHYSFVYNPMLNSLCYTRYGFSWWQGMLFKLYFTAMAFLMIAVFLILFQEKKRIYSYIGDHTMSVYALHCIVFLSIRQFGLFNKYSWVQGVGMAFLVAVTTVFVLSVPKVCDCYMAGCRWMTRMEKRYVMGIKPQNKIS